MLQSEPSRRDRAPDRQDPERQGSVRDRLDLIGSVLRELDLLRQRQELLVRTALQAEQVQEAQLDSEENILVLNHVRRRDAALITQLHQLDEQIQDLRLDLDPDLTQDQLEPESRPSSDFYELSDGTSASLSNSSHSVFSEGFCSAADSEGPVPLKEKPDGSLDRDVLVGGLAGDVSSWPQSCQDPTPLLVPKEFQSKPSSGCETGRYPVPPQTVAVQDQGSPQTRDRAATEPEPVPQSTKHLDRYIYSLLQRRVQPIRTSRPRTSFCTDLSKTVLRQTSQYGRPGSGPDSGSRSPKPSSAESGPVSCPQRQSEEQNVGPGLRVHTGCPVPIWDNKRVNGPYWSQGSPSANSAHKKPKQPGVPTDQDLDPEPLLGDSLGTSWEKPRRTQTNSSRNGSQLLQSFPEKNPEKTVPQISRLVTGGGRDGAGLQVGLTWSQGAEQPNLKYHRGTSKNTKMVLGTLVVPGENKLPLDKTVHTSGSRTVLVLDSSSVHMRTPHRGRAFRKKNISERRVLNKHSRSINLQSGGCRPRPHGLHRPYSHHRRASKYEYHRTKLEDHQNKSEDHRSKHEDHWQLHVISEVPSDRETKRVPQLQRHPASGGPKTGRSSCGTGSDSEDSAEGLSLVHSTIEDSSEDGSHYTTNCFGDRESSEDESLDQDLEESMGGGSMVRGRVAEQPGPKQDQGLTKTGVKDPGLTKTGLKDPGLTKTGLKDPGLIKTGLKDPGLIKTGLKDPGLIKIKASHNLKKKILRSRSGSLKLMTTM